MNSGERLSRRQVIRISAVSGLAILGAASTTAFLTRAAVAQNGDTQYVCNANNVNVRANFGLSGKIIGTLNTGDIVNLAGGSATADGYTWLNVTKAGSNLNGWVASDFLDQGSTGGWAAGTAVHVNSNNVNLRSGASLGSSVVAVYGSDTNATIQDGPVQASGYQWYKIQVTGGATGWMASDFLSEGSAGGGPGNGFPQGAWMMTTTDLNLRSAPGTGSSVIAVYPGGTVLTVLSGPEAANGYQWYKVELADDKKVGWFAGEFLDFAPTEPTGSQVRVVDGPLNVRSTPSLSGAVLLTVPTGATGRVADASFVQADGYVWVSVQWFNQNNTVGWVAKNFIAWI